MDNHQCLRCSSYMCPGLPIEYYELILQYLEEKLSCFTELVYESRWTGPPQDRPDPFSSDRVDIAFVDTFTYLSMVKKGNPDAELLPVSSVHVHSKGEDRPGYFADVITHIDEKSRVKEFMDLRGCKWAYSRLQSISGNLITLRTLKELGENYTFFGNTLQSGSDIKSIELVLSKAADAACVDSNVIMNYINKNPAAADQLFVVTSWGMLAPYPILVNTKLSEDLKQKIISALLTMHQDVKWGPKLNSFKVRRFSKTSFSNYEEDVITMEMVKSLHSGNVYY